MPPQLASDPRGGFAFAFAAAMLFAWLVILGKTVLKTLGPWEFVAFFFSFGALYYVIYFTVRREWKAFTPSRGAMLGGVGLGLLDVGFAVTWSYSLQILQPAVHSFLGHMADIFTAIVGIAILRERYNRTELAGIALAFVGLGTMAYRSSDFMLKGIAFMAVSGAFFAANAVLVRRLTQRYPPINLAFYRAVVLAVVLHLVGWTSIDGFRLPDRQEWLLVAIMGFIGPFLHQLCFYHALKRMEIGRVSVTRSTYSVIVLVVAYFVYDDLPSTQRLVGGLGLLLGTVVVILEKARAQRAS
jgi:drug/metabolite transporter (DMT)-like permease